MNIGALSQSHVSIEKEEGGCQSQRNMVWAVLYIQTRLDGEIFPSLEQVSV